MFYKISKQKVIMKYKEQAYLTYEKFSKLEGNQHIASDYALEFILKLIKDFKVKNVLEVGLGIGAICDTVLNYSKQNNLKISYTGTEANEFCLNALPKNVDFFGEIDLFSSVKELPQTNTYDLIIVDGADEATKEIKKHVKQNTIVFIEGCRTEQVEAIKKVFPTAIYAEIISCKHPPVYGPFNQKWSGGGGLIFVNPNFKQKRYALVQKANTFFKRRMRKFVK